MKEKDVATKRDLEAFLNHGGRLAQVYTEEISGNVFDCNGVRTL